MKTTYSFLKRTCLFLALFSWLLPMNLSADVTVEWGDWGSPVIALPNATSSTVDNITVSTNLPTYNNAWLGGGNPNAYNSGDGGVIDIQTANGLVITQVSAAIWYGSSVSFTIDFASTDSYSAGSSLGGQAMEQHAQGDPTLTNITAPANARSARITCTGSDGWGGYLYRLVVTAEAASCANPINASFAKEGSETGNAPAVINSCEGNTIIIPDQGSLVKTGCDFVGWSYNSTTYHPGDHFEMPATNVTFTAVWEQHYVPAVTNLSSSVSGSDVTLNWINYNKLEMTSSNVAIEGFSDGHSMSFTINNGVLECEYEIGWGWGYKSVEIRLPRERNHVTSIDLKYIFNDPNCSSGGGLIPYMMYDGYETGHENNWTSYYLDYTSYNATEWTDFNLVPTTILWGSGSGAYDNQWLIHKVGFAANPPVASSGTFSIKDIYINTSDGQTLLDEVIVVRNEDHAPTSVSDGTPVYNGLLNTCTDNSLADGDYYYAVFAREGDAYSAAVVTQVHIGAVVPSLTTHTRNLPVGEYGTICLPYEVLAANIEGADVFELAGWPADADAVTLNQIAGDMEAGHPYIFQATAATSTFSYEESGYQDAQTVKGLVGSYTKELIEANANNYIIYDNKLYLVDVEAYVGANRAYINRTAAQGAVASPAPGKRQIVLYVNGTETTTGFDQLNSTSANGKFIKDGQLFIIRDGRTYNAQGIEIK